MRARFLLAAGLLCGAATLAAEPAAFVGRNWTKPTQDSTPAPTSSVVAPPAAAGTVQQAVSTQSPNCLNCAPPSVRVWAAAEETIATGSENTTKMTGGIYAEAPVTIGGEERVKLDGQGAPVLDSAGKPVIFKAGETTVARAFTRLVFQPQPGASTLYDIHNYNGFEWMAGASRVLGQSQGVSLSLVGAVWWGTRFSTGDLPDPLQHGHMGWGGGLKLRHKDGHVGTLLCGQDGSIGDDGAMQCRTWGRVMVPKTYVKGSAVGSVYFDILASLLHPAPLVVPVPAPPTAPVVNFVANVGIGINADAIFGLFK